MTVLFFSPSFYPHIGGVEKHVFEIARRLKKRGHRVLVITEDREDRKEKIQGVEVYRVNFGKKGWLKKIRIWLKILSYRRLIELADVVHCHDVFFWYLPFKFIYPKKKVFITFHGFENTPPGRKEIFIRKLSEEMTYGNFIVGDYIKKWYKTNPNFVTYGGIDRIHPYINNKSSLGTKILLVGRLDKDIGINNYINLLGRLKNYKLDVCGDGGFRKTLEKYGTVHGFVKRLGPFIKSADVVFASSYLSMLEALSFGKPVVVTYDNDLKRDYIKMSPFRKLVISSSSPKVLSDKVKLILRNKNLRRVLAKKSMDWVNNQTWDILTNKYLSLWGEK